MSGGRGAKPRKGSPAWAGIDRLRPSQSLCGEWFPRVGGDRPMVVVNIDGEPVVPPRGRG